MVCSDSSHSQTALLAELGAGGLAGSASRVVEQVVMCVATSQADVIAAVIFGAFASLLMPAASSLLSKNTASFEQVPLSNSVHLALVLWGTWHVPKLLSNHQCLDIVLERQHCAL